jgi:hypothetical protein
MDKDVKIDKNSEQIIIKFFFVLKTLLIYFSKNIIKNFLLQTFLLSLIVSKNLFFERILISLLSLSTV